MRRPLGLFSRSPGAALDGRIPVRGCLLGCALLLAPAGLILACGGDPASGATVPGRVDGQTAPSAAVTEAHRRADAAFEALVAHFWDPKSGSFRMAPGGEPAQYWIAAQALDAALDAYGRTGGRLHPDLPAAFIRAQEARGWSRDFFDDESWMALALLRAYDLTGEPLARDRAAALWADIQAHAPDPSCCGVHPGGLWWDRKHSQKATAANAGAVITAARMFQHGGGPDQLAFARRVFDYWFAEMVDPATGQVADHVLPSGEKVWWRFSYNEGTMIGAAIELYHATGELPYLDAARKIGAFLLARETAPSPAGRVLFDGSSCSGDCEQFKGIAQRYLAVLAEADPAGGWGALVQADAAAVWELGRDGATDTFGVSWAGPPGPATLATQSSAAMALDAAARALGRGP